MSVDFDPETGSLGNLEPLFDDVFARNPRVPGKEDTFGLRRRGGNGPSFPSACGGGIGPMAVAGCRFEEPEGLQERFLADPHPCLIDRIR